MKRIISLLAVIVVVAAGVWGYLYTQGIGNAPKYRLARVERGPLTAAVSASGTLNGVVMVLVGSQVSGQIKDLFVDFNTAVRKGQVIARIDPQMFEAQVRQAAADVEAARAAVLNTTAAVEKARADLENARAALVQGKAQTAKSDVSTADAKRIYERNAELWRRDLIAQADRDTSQASYEAGVAQLDASRANEQSLAAAIQSAQAQLRVQEAMLKSAQAQVEQKQAALKQAQINLDYTTIRAPVDGIVVSRAVDVGQTVAASLQAPTLFTIAQDLTRMQVETSVDEADIGRIKLDGPAVFTVDAFPGDTFIGRISQIRKAAQVVQNVVTYTVIVEVPNPTGKLFPGMTANVKLVVAEKPSVLKVSNAALRFRPAGADAGPMPGAPGRGGAPSTGARGAGSGGDRASGGGERGGAMTAGGGAGGGRLSPEAIRERLTKGLGLSEEQQKKLEPILQDSREQFMAMRGESLSDADRQARGQNIREATRARIRAILTPPQQAKYDEMAPQEGRGGTAGRVWVLGRDGKPEAVSIVLGLSDGTATEVLRGLTEGQEVVIGSIGASGKPAQPTGTQQPRLRL